MGWRCTCSIVSPVRLWILWGAILARKVSIHLVLTKHRRVFFNCSRLLFIPRKLNPSLHHFSDFGVRFLDQILCFLYCGARQPAYGNCGDIQCQAHVGLFELYMTSLSCHSCRHVENVEEISCCFEQCDSASTLTTYASVPSTMVIEVYFVHFRGFALWYLSMTIPELTVSRCSISQTVRTNALVNNGGFPLSVPINWLCSSLRTLSVHYTVIRWPFSMVWIYKHPTARCFIFLLLLVLWTIYKCASRVICMVAAVAASHWTNRYLLSCCVRLCDILDETAIILLDSYLVTPGWGVCVSMIAWCWIGDEDDNEKKWKSWRIYS